MDYIEIIAIFFLIVAILILVYYFVLANSTSFNGLNLKVPSLNSESVEMPSSAKSVNRTFDDDFLKELKQKYSEYEFILPLGSNGEKMSKSIGNVVDPVEILAKHGLTPFRYYFLRHASTTEDSDFTWDKYEAAYNELANDLGNLVQRLATLAKKNGLKGQSVELVDLPEFDERMTKYEFNFAFEILWKQIMDLNKRIDEEKPWALAKTDPAKAAEVLNDIIKSLLETNKRLAIFIPDTAKAIEEIFSADEIVPPATPLFPKN